MEMSGNQRWVILLLFYKGIGRDIGLAIWWVKPTEGDEHVKDSHKYYAGRNQPYELRTHLSAEETDDTPTTRLLDDWKALSWSMKCLECNGAQALILAISPTIVRMKPFGVKALFMSSGERKMLSLYHGLADCYRRISTAKLRPAEPR